MIFRGANPFDQLTPGVQKLLIANVGIFLLQMIAPGAWGMGYLALTPVQVIENFYVWQIFTYSFLHGSGWHLFFNMFALWMVGPHIEGMWGTKKFVRYYFLCVVGAAVAQFILAPTSVVVGASGAIYGLLIAFGLLFPDAVIYLFFVFPARAIQAVAFIAILTLVSAINSGGDRIAHFAHLGGMLTGFLYFKLPIWWENYRLWKARRLFANPRGVRKPKPLDSTDNLKDEVDRILEKISTKGVDSLTPEEHGIMQRYAQRMH